MLVEDLRAVSRAHVELRRRLKDADRPPLVDEVKSIALLAATTRKQLEALRVLQPAAPPDPLGFLDGLDDEDEAKAHAPAQAAATPALAPARPPAPIDDRYAYDDADLRREIEGGFEE